METSAVQPSFTSTLLTRSLAITGVAGMAITQPVLDLFGRNPEFFIAGNYSDRQIIWFAIIVMSLPAAFGIALTAIAMAVDRRAGSAVFGIVIGLLGGAWTLALLRTAGIDPLVFVVVLAVVGAALIAFGVMRTRPLRLLACYLAVANLGFAALFLLGSRTAELVAGGTALDLGRVEVPGVRGPVVVIVLDEFAAATIMRPNGEINADRYPGFAELASVSTWFRNASSQHNLTHRAVPQILEGRIGEEGVLPTADDHPRNLFTLLGGDLPVARYESVTDMCPDSICDPPPPRSLSRALEDASIVYGHRVLPPALRDDLAAIDDSWGGFGVDDTGGGVDAAAGDDGDEPSYIQQAYSHWRGLGADERSPLGQAGIMSAQVEAITAEPALHFVHIAIPHRPWVLSRTGIGTSFLPEIVTDPSDPAYDFENRMEFQLHSMQVGAADSLVADLLERLQALPNWDDTLLVVTSDHGTNLTPPNLGRMRITEENREEALRIPLFIKAPGQTEGEVRDDSAQTIDVLPSIVDLLDVDVDWEYDGHSLFDGSDATIEPRVADDVESVLEIARRRAEEFPYGDDWVALAAVGDHGELVGREVDEFTIGEASAYRVTIDQADEFESLPTPDGEMPFALSGRVDGPDNPPELLVAVNGRLAGVIGGYRPAGGGWTLMGYVADLYVEGANDVAVYEVEDDGTAVTLRPAEQPVG
jgi:hypothetical protein